jgi:predicted nucleotidyltransferase
VTWGREGRTKSGRAASVGTRRVTPGQPCYPVPVLSPAERSLLVELKRALVDRYGDRLIGLSLFGSRARGEGRGDSDVDVLVDIRDVTMGERGDVLDLADDLGVEYGLVLSPLVRREGVRIPREILAEAVPL